MLKYNVAYKIVKDGGDRVTSGRLGWLVKFIEGVDNAVDFYLARRDGDFFERGNWPASKLLATTLVSFGYVTQLDASEKKAMSDGDDEDDYDDDDEEDEDYEEDEDDCPGEECEGCDDCNEEEDEDDDMNEGGQTFFSGMFYAIAEAGKEAAPAAIGQQGIDAAADVATKYFRDNGYPQMADFVSGKVGRDLLRVLIPAAALSFAEQYPDNTMAQHLAEVMQPTLMGGMFLAQRDILQTLIMPMVAQMLAATGYDFASMTTPKLPESKAQPVTPVAETGPAEQSKSTTKGRAR